MFFEKKTAVKLLTIHFVHEFFDLGRIDVVLVGDHERRMHLSLDRFAVQRIDHHRHAEFAHVIGILNHIGVFIPAVLANGFIIMGVQPFWQMVVVGFVVIAAVYADQLKRQSQDRG
jgi:hypothetical protein